MLRNILQDIGQPPQQRIIQPKMALVLRLRNLDLNHEAFLLHENLHTAARLERPVTGVYGALNIQSTITTGAWQKLAFL